jgi:hypothetical protein
MSNDSIPPGTGSPKRIRRLAATTADGTSYERWKDILSEMKGIARRPPSQWIAERKEIHNETLVFLLRRAGRNDLELYTALAEELFRRTRRIATRVIRVWVLDRLAQADIVAVVDVQIFELVFEKEPTRAGRFLETAFNMVVEQRTKNAIFRHLKTPFGNRGEYVPFTDGQDFDEGEAIERPMELAPDTRPGPLALCIQDEEGKGVVALYNRALAVIKARLCRKVIKLHFCEGLPISSKDPEVKTVARVLKKTPLGRIKHLLTDGMKTMRAALIPEVQHD